MFGCIHFSFQDTVFTVQEFLKEFVALWSERQLTVVYGQVIVSCPPASKSSTSEHTEGFSPSLPSPKAHLVTTVTVIPVIHMLLAEFTNTL